MAGQAQGEERQITFTPKNHMLDNNDNFSPDQRFLAYDTRETIGPGIDNCQSVEMVEIATGEETVLYAPEKTITGDKAAPGVGAASFSPTKMRVAFIHGPLVDDVDERGYYGKPNRNGAEVPADGSQRLTWLDHRDVRTDGPTTPGAHRGGTHRHEYCLKGDRIGFTYDDFLLPQYQRTIGYMEPRDDAPGDASHWFALLLKPVLEENAQAGDIVKAYGDSWVGRDGAMRGFIGVVKEPDGSYQESLFVVDVPRSVDITTADAGSADRYPEPPQGLTVRRLTHDYAQGIIRGTADGDRIAYYGKDGLGRTQIFVIPSDGSDQSGDPAKLPVMATLFEHGAGDGVRWHPSGDFIACISNNAVAVTCVKPGERFGKTVWLTDSKGPERSQLVWSPDGSVLAYNKPVPTKDANGNVVKTYDGKDFSQIFMIDFAVSAF